MKNQSVCIRFWVAVSVSLCLFWADSRTVSAQTPDSAIMVKPQPADHIVWKTPYPTKKQRQAPRAVLKLDAGYGWRVGKINDELNDYGKYFFNHLMSGFAWDASFDFFFNDKFGIRMAFHQYISSHSDLARNLDTGEQGVLDVQDIITYICPAFVFRLPFGQNLWMFHASAGMGYMEYREKFSFVNVNSKMYGATVGIQMGVGIEYRVAPRLGIGINTLITSGVITTFQYNVNGIKSTVTFEEDTGEGLFQISQGVGIRYYFK